MGDAQVLQSQFFIQNHPVAEVGFEQIRVGGGKGIQCKGLVVSGKTVDDLLELGKHGLPEKGAPDIVDLPVQDIGLHLWVVRIFFQQVVSQKGFVEGGSHLCHKDGVVMADVWLCLFGKVRVHGMAGFVNQGEQAVDGVAVIVEKDIWR